MGVQEERVGTAVGAREEGVGTAGEAGIRGTGLQVTEVRDSGAAVDMARG